jgi:hypothetical protein
MIWLGQIREVHGRPGRWPSADALVLHTDDGREIIKGRSETIRIVDEALYDARRGPHGRALPSPPPAQPALVGGWVTRIAAILRPR